MLRLLRLAILLVMTFVVLSLIIAVAGPETGPAEKLILSLAVLGVLFAAGLVQRLGSGRA
ncbi:MAG: hypothetical protein ACR2KK_03550 [Acidimicrobiales bacterium]